MMKSQKRSEKMLDEIKEAFYAIFVGDAPSVMMDEPAGIFGIFIMPIVIMGFLVAANYTTYVNARASSAINVISNSPYCQTPHYLFLNSIIQPAGFAIKMQCLASHFGLGVFLSYYFQLLILIFILACVAINTIGPMVGL